MAKPQESKPSSFLNFFFFSAVLCKSGDSFEGGKNFSHFLKRLLLKFFEVSTVLRRMQRTTGKNHGRLRAGVKRFLNWRLEKGKEMKKETKNERGRRGKELLFFEKKANQRNFTRGKERLHGTKSQAKQGR